MGITADDDGFRELLLFSDPKLMGFYGSNT